jgi:hypothetical protein
MNASTARALTLFSAFLACGVAACGGGAVPSAQTAAPPEPAPEREPSTIEEAQDQISRARDGLSARPGATQPAEPAPPATKAPTADVTASESSKTAPKPSGGVAVEEARCSSPCRALSSMRRAVAALCRMTGDSDARCIDAKRILSDSERSVSPCAC